MIKVYCDMCGKNIEKATIYRAVFSVYDHDIHSFNATGQEVDLCTECHEKIINIKDRTGEPETHERTESLKKDMKELQETTKKPEAEKEKPEAPDPKGKKIDDGKIWALAHGKLPWTTRQIAEEMNIPQSTVSYHLRKMREERSTGKGADTTP